MLNIFVIVCILPRTLLICAFLYYGFLFRNMLSMERERFKAQPLTRSCLPYEAPHHLPPPPRMRSLGKREGEFHTRRTNQTKTISMAPRKLIAHTRASERLTHHTQKRTHTQEVTELYARPSRTGSPSMRPWAAWPWAPYTVHT